MAIPHTATAAGIIARRLIRRIFFEPSIGNLPLITARSRPDGIPEFPNACDLKYLSFSVNLSRVADFPETIRLTSALRLTGLGYFAIETGHDCVDECVNQKLAYRLPCAHVRSADRTRDIDLGRYLLGRSILQ